MEASTPRRILIVAHRTAATPPLIEEVRRRSSEGACRFTLLVPRPFWDPDTEEGAITLELAIPLLDEAAGSHVEGLIGDTDPFAAVSGELGKGEYDEVIISTLPARVSHWLHLDLPARVQRLGSAGDGDNRPQGRPTPRAGRLRPRGQLAIQDACRTLTMAAR